MTPLTTAASSISDRANVDATSQERALPHDGNRNLYFQRYLYRDYKDSVEGNPNLDVAWSIFEDIVGNSAYEIITIGALLHDFGHTSELALLTHNDLHVRNLLVTGAPLISEYDPEAEDKLFLPDSREQGLTMNWGRARELRKKLADRKKLTEQ